MWALLCLDTPLFSYLPTAEPSRRESDLQEDICLGPAASVSLSPLPNRLIFLSLHVEEGLSPNPWHPSCPDTHLLSKEGWERLPLFTSGLGPVIQMRSSLYQEAEMFIRLNMTPEARLSTWPNPVSQQIFRRPTL